MTMKNNILIDSGFLFALYDQSNRHHPLVKRVAETRSETFIIPDVVLTEVAFLFNRARGIPALAQFLQEFAKTQPHLEPVTANTLQRMSDIMIAYHDARFDFVDCCIMALAEQMQITQIGTLDRRDFSIYRPAHCEYFDLLP
jgi:predicted nucleic acid-binding protein